MKVWRLSFCFLLFQISQEKMGGFVVKFWILRRDWITVVEAYSQDTGPSQPSQAIYAKQQRHHHQQKQEQGLQGQQQQQATTTTSTTTTTRTTTTTTTQSLNFKRPVLGPGWFKSPSVNYLPTKWCCFLRSGPSEIQRSILPHILLQEENPENCL